MSDHSFNVELAKFAGVPQAIFISHLKFWTIINIGNKKNFINGLYWSYYTYEALQVIFPYYTKKQLEGIIERCIEFGLITKAKHTKSKWDRTNWFALTSEAYKFYPDIHEAIEKISQLTISPKGEMDDPKKEKCTFLQKEKCTNTDNITHIKTTNTTTRSPQDSNPMDVSQIASSSGFVISEEVDRELLIFNQSHEMHAKDNQEFLMWCKYCFESLIKVHSFAEKLNILKSWIKKGGLTKPKGFGGEKTNNPYDGGYKTSFKPIEVLRAQWEGYLGFFNTAKALGRTTRSCALTFREWLQKEGHSLEALNIS